MKQLKLFLISVVLLMSMALVFSACGGSEGKSEEEKMDYLLDLQDDVVRVHDDVMPLTSNINRARQTLMSYFEENQGEIEEKKEKEIQSLIERLNDAHDGMFDWMGDWADTDQAAMEYDEAIEYYDIEMERIKQVAEDMRSSVSDAEELLEELGLN